MALKFLQQAAAKRHQIFMSHVSAEMQARIADPRPVTFAEYSACRANSYERHLLYPKMDNECLMEVAKHCQTNCSRQHNPQLPSTYDEVLIHIIVPLLLQRLEQLNAAAVH